MNIKINNEYFIAFDDRGIILEGPVDPICKLNMFQVIMLILKIYKPEKF
jgi:hypothetical protein